MPSELDYLNHNVYHADAEAIRGARETEQALRYLPFVTITNTAGFGSQFDMRGQGRLASNGVKMYINGVSANPVDTYYGYMPINTLIPSLIQEIEVYPGSGAVLYGSGTKGGTINVITSKRQNPYFMVGGGYLNSHGTNSFNGFAHAAERFGTIGINAGVAYTQMGGPRDDDKSNNAQGVLGVTVPLGIGSQIDFDIDFYYGKRKSTPYNTLVDEAGVRSAVLNNGFNDVPAGYTGSGWAETARQNAALLTPSLEPSKDNRGENGLGEIDTTQMRLNASLGYTVDLAQKLQWNVTGLFGLDNRKYNTYKIFTPVFVLGGTNLTTYQPENSWYIMRPLPQNNANLANINPIVDGISGEYPYLDLSGSSFNEIKGGAKTEFSWKHDNGEFIFGLSGMYEKSKRNLISYLRSPIPWIGGNTDGGIDKTGLFRAIEATLDDNMDINVITAAVYLYERYRINPNFSIAGGARYEMKNYDVKVEDHYKANRIVMQKSDGNYGGTGSTTDQNTYIYGGDAFIRDLYSNSADPINNPTHDYSKNYDNFTFELSPAFNYSNSGLVYLHGEFGYVAPPAWATVQRFGKFMTNGNDDAPNTIATDPNDTATPNTSRYTLNFMYRDTELKSETYWTAELGWKDSIVNRQVPLGFMTMNIDALLFSVSAFYTDSTNEFYFDGDTYSGMTFGNYDKSRRIGAEVALEQIIFNNAISLNESFTYLKAQYKDANGGWATIPYTYDWKGTVGVALDVGGFIEVMDVSLAVWLQNSIYGNQQVPTREVTAAPGAGGGNTIVYTIGETTTKKLKPYLVSDLGITVEFAKALSVTAGVKNVFDTFYYDYYNNDKAAVINENRYLIGRGRTVFVEAAFKY